MHSAALAHALPAAFFARHAPPAPQYVVVGLAQSAAVTHAAHAPFTHFCAPQSTPLVAFVQLFAPVHTLPTTRLPLHVFVPPPQSVPAGHVSHAPDPLHCPFCPHVVGDCCAHSLSGSVPTAMLPHAPFDPPPFFAALHA